MRRMCMPRFSESCETGGSGDGVEDTGYIATQVSHRAEPPVFKRLSKLSMLSSTSLRPPTGNRVNNAKDDAPESDSFPRTQSLQLPERIPRVRIRESESSISDFLNGQQPSTTSQPQSQSSASSQGTGFVATIPLCLPAELQIIRLSESQESLATKGSEDLLGEVNKSKSKERSCTGDCSKTDLERPDSPVLLRPKRLQIIRIETATSPTDGFEVSSSGSKVGNTAKAEVAQSDASDSIGLGDINPEPPNDIVNTLRATERGQSQLSRGEESNPARPSNYQAVDGENETNVRMNREKESHVPSQAASHSVGRLKTGDLSGSSHRSTSAGKSRRMGEGGHDDFEFNIVRRESSSANAASSSLNRSSSHISSRDEKPKTTAAKLSRKKTEPNRKPTARQAPMLQFVSKSARPSEPRWLHRLPKPAST